ncbi:MAG: response regulator [Syntrophomonas sp.]
MSIKVKKGILAILLFIINLPLFFWFQETLGKFHFMAAISVQLAIVFLLLFDSLFFYLTFSPSRNTSEQDSGAPENSTSYEAFLLANIDECIVVSNMKGEILCLSQKARDVFGIIPDEDRADNLFLKIFSYEKKKLKEIQQELLSGNSWEGECKFTVHDQEKTFMHRLHPLEKEGEVKTIVLISTDISELVATREEAQAAIMAKNQFLANMSHELRTPMIGILGAADLLEQSRLNSEQSANVNIIRECGEQLLGVINEILDVAKIEIGLVTLHPEHCNLAEVFARATRTIEPLLKEKGLALRTNIDKQLPSHVIIDQVKLGQVLLNILYNAIKFTSSGCITIKAKVESGQSIPSCLLVSVKDTGIGIPSGQVGRIFDAFTQVDNSNTREFTGTGLGLFICKKVLELMQGEIWLESIEGDGTTFYFKVPVEIIPAGELQPADKHAEPAAANNNNMLLEFNPIRVLLVEDNPLNRKIVGQMLMNYGFEVMMAPNGLECLKLLNDNQVDIILMDMQMPVMDGYETTRFIREDKNLSHLPVIAMTAHAMSGDRQKCLACGCSSYIAKPFKSEELVQMIRNNLPSNSPRSNASDPAKLLICELIPEFIQGLAEMIEELDVAVKTNDFEMIQSISHDIKGSAGMYDFVEISQTAAAIEQSVHQHAYHKIAPLSTHLYSLLQQANRQVS